MTENLGQFVREHTKAAEDESEHPKPKTKEPKT
jgi:hypothetical protein